MKKKIFLVFFPVVLLMACVDNLDDYNIDQKRAAAVPARTLFSGAVKNLTDVITTPNVNTNNFRLFAQHWTTTTYLNEPRYNMVSRTYSQNFWQPVYRDILSDLKESRRIVEGDAVLASEVKNNQLAIIDIMDIYAWTVLVNTFGDVPYSEALNPANPLPK